jgi:hypothetical protein
MNALNLDQKIQLMKDANARRGPSIEGEESQEFYDKVLAEIEENKGRGIACQMPYDWPDLDEIATRYPKNFSEELDKYRKKNQS